MKHLSVLCLVLFASILLSACGAAGGQAAAPSTPIPTVVADNVIIAEGHLEPIQYADIAFNANGTVSEVLVTAGEQVTAGQVIARLDNSEAKQAEVAQVEEAFLSAQQAFDSSEVTALGKLAESHEAVRKAQFDFDNFDVPSEIRGMSTTEALTYTAGKLETARLKFEPYKYQEERLEREINRDNPKEPNEQVYRSTAKNYKKQLDDAWAHYNKAIKWATLESDLENAQAELAKYQKEYDLLSAGSNSSDKAIAQAQYEAARAKLVAAQAALAEVELRAPFDGTVASLDVKTGETVTPGQVAASLADFSGWLVKTTDLTELDVVSINEGQSVLIALDAFPEETLNGKVLRIGQKYSEKQGDIVYEVTVELTEALQNMRWGMTAVVKFEQ
jgi:multidrug efflux pump subunit AcrA (membrane-fusion protein)